jgi:CheY-like chemotaxis protein
MTLSLLDRSEDTESGRRPAGEKAGWSAGGEQDAAVAPASQPADATAATPRVLVVDDNTTMRGEIRALLEEAGCAVVGEAGHGAEGVMLARELRPDVVVMDVRMPILDGIAATGHLTRELPDTRVIVFSVFEDELLADAAEAAGASSFLIKGASPAAILAAVKGTPGRS